MVEILGQSLPIVLFTLGVVLAIAEAIAPGAHFIVLGVALIIAGLIGLLLGAFNISGVFLTLALAMTVVITGAIALVAYRELDFYTGTGVGKTRDSGALKGATGRVTERVSPTGGEIKLDQGGFNPYYRAKTVAGEVAIGEEVVVVDPGGGNVVTVESLGPMEDEIDRQLREGSTSTQKEFSTEKER